VSTERIAIGREDRPAVVLDRSAERRDGYRWCRRRETSCVEAARSRLRDETPLLCTRFFCGSHTSLGSRGTASQGKLHHCRSGFERGQAATMERHPYRGAFIGASQEKTGERKARGLAKHRTMMDRGLPSSPSFQFQHPKLHPEQVRVLHEEVVGRADEGLVGEPVGWVGWRVGAIAVAQEKHGAGIRLI
jgi:hypothetical protein